MKIILKCLAIIVLALICSVGTIYMYDKCPKRNEALLQTINNEINNYVEKNTNLILEKMAKDDGFRNTVISALEISAHK